MAALIAIAVGSFAFTFERSNQHWTTFTSAEGGYSAAFPGQPITEGNSERVTTSSGLFLVRYGDLPSADVETLYSQLPQVKAAELRGQVVSAKRLTQFGVPALEYVVESERLRYEGHYFVHGRRLYEVSVTAEHDSDPKAVEHFFSSFRLTR